MPPGGGPSAGPRDRQPERLRGDVEPQPQPSASMVEKIKSFIADLNADDWKQRDRAQAALIGMGSVAAGPLREMRIKQPPEAQRAIDIILQKLEEQRQKEKTPLGASTTPAPAIPVQNQNFGF